MKTITKIYLVIGIVAISALILFNVLTNYNSGITDVGPIKEKIGLQTSEVNIIDSGANYNFPSKENSSETVSVRDFKSDPGVIEWGDQNTLVLGDGLIADDPAFQIFYYELDKSFSIAILQEPIGDVRKIAEVQLLERLQVTPSDACKLTISVTVPSFVDENIAGQDLGLSFCPGAVQL